MWEQSCDIEASFMPNYKGHLVGGTVGFVLVIFFCSLHQSSCTQLLEWLLCVLAGSLFPDIDTKSKGQKLFYAILCMVMFVCLVQEQLKLLAGLALAGMLPLLVNHRGIFHRLWFVMVLITVATFLLSTAYPFAQQRLIFDAAFFSLGAISHLYLDVGVKKMFRIP